MNLRPYYPIHLWIELILFVSRALRAGKSSSQHVKELKILRLSTQSLAIRRNLFANVPMFYCGGKRIRTDDPLRARQVL